MVDEEAARVFKLDTATGIPVKSMSLPDSASGDPNSWGLTWDGEHLWHSQYYSNPKIFELDTATGAVIAEFTPPASLILGIVWSDGNLWGVDIESMTAYVMELPSGSVLRQYQWKVPYPLGLELRGGYLWNVSSAEFGGGTRRVYQVDPGTGGLEQQQLPSQPRACPMQPYPNPFARCTHLRCGPGKSLVADASVYDTRGRLVRRLVVGAGNELVWDGADGSGTRVVGGVYFVRLELNGGRVERATVRLLPQK
jgi:hypothetical protein